MVCNQNEKCLLKFISNNSVLGFESELLKIILKLGIKLKFNNYNSTYQIIDELTFCTQEN